ALDASRGEWVLNVDADERVTPDLTTKIRAALGGVPPEVVGFAIPRRVCYLGRWWYRGGWYPRPIVRLVRRTATRWGGVDPHERAEVKGRVARLRWPLLHYTYRDITAHLRSLNKLTSVAAGQPQLPQRLGARRVVAEPAWRFVRSYLVHRGFVGGGPGLFAPLPRAPQRPHTPRSPALPPPPGGPPPHPSAPPCQDQRARGRRGAPRDHAARPARVERREPDPPEGSTWDPAPRLHHPP